MWTRGFQTRIYPLPANDAILAFSFIMTLPYPLVYPVLQNVLACELGW